MNFTYIFRNSRCIWSKIEIAKRVTTLYYRPGVDELSTTCVMRTNHRGQPYVYIHEGEPDHRGLHADQTAQPFHHHIQHPHLVSQSDLVGLLQKFMAYQKSSIEKFMEIPKKVYLENYIKTQLELHKEQVQQAVQQAPADFQLTNKDVEAHFMRRFAERAEVEWAAAEQAWEQSDINTRGFITDEDKTELLKSYSEYCDAKVHSQSAPSAATTAATSQLPMYRAAIAASSAASSAVASNTVIEKTAQENWQVSINEIMGPKFIKAYGPDAWQITMTADQKHSAHLRHPLIELSEKNQAYFRTKLPFCQFVNNAAGKWLVQLPSLEDHIQELVKKTGYKA